MEKEAVFWRVFRSWTSAEKVEVIGCYWSKVAMFNGDANFGYHNPYHPCMGYLPTFTINLSQM